MSTTTSDTKRITHLSLTAISTTTTSTYESSHNDAHTPSMTSSAFPTDLARATADVKDQTGRRLDRIATQLRDTADVAAETNTRLAQQTEQIHDIDRTLHDSATALDATHRQLSRLDRLRGFWSRSSSRVASTTSSLPSAPSAPPVPPVQPTATLHSVDAGIDRRLDDISQLLDGLHASASAAGAEVRRQTQMLQGTEREIERQVTATQAATARLRWHLSA